MAIKEHLVKINVYDEVKDGFIDKCLIAGINLLKKQKSLEAYEGLYQFLKNTVFDALDISINIHTRYPRYLAEYETIMHCSVAEYLFYKLNEKELHRTQFPYHAVGKCRRIALYAAGRVGKEYYKQLIDNDRYYIIGWFDNNYRTLQERGLPVADPMTIGEYHFEKIVVAVEKESLYREIREQLVRSGVGREKIIWKKY